MANSLLGRYALSHEQNNTSRPAAAGGYRPELGKVSEVVERVLKERRVALPKRERFTVDASWYRLQLSRR